ncbi:MAG: putative manganese-dependent inorganic diphosphatase [Spirochaetaceae bacterium]|jgi:manganese-dependent inorganic pyrophosphatase|nr:putative manganese-dependent inorganic diphosphatase [Spirochaetaceae bacterium]GMO19047.1 MAG: putative manganese-dependent inorganic diphosphatase [Termitinemataceae bacterium]
MEKQKTKNVYIMGHRNPDTDSCVSAAAYARLKQLLGYNEYIAVRGGKLSPQTEYIFNRFETPFPQYIPDMIPKVTYYMKRDVKAVYGGTSLWNAITDMEQLKTKVIPVINEDGTYCSLLNYNAFAHNILKILDPETSTLFSTNIRLITETLNAQQVLGYNVEELFKCVIIVVSDSIDTFRKTLTLHTPENAVIITADRTDVQEYAIQSGVRALILSSGTVISKELRSCAEKKKVSVLISPYRSAETAMLVMYSAPASEMADTSVKPVKALDTIRYVRPLLRDSTNRALPVVDDAGKLVGTISESDLLAEPNTDVILVDHNEISQALEGIENYTIREVIDHHRLGNLNTKEPISFINRPVGATCTIIVSLYRQNRVPIPKNIAGLLLAGILADTLVLQSATVTDEDKDTALYLSNITNLDIEVLGREIISAGNKLGNRTAIEVIKQDMKEYNEAGGVFTVSQIEVESLEEVLERKDEFLNELEIERRSRDALFCTIMVTDVIKLTSLMIIAALPEFLRVLDLPVKETGVYSLRGVVSRKKQLVPLLTEQVEKLAGSAE